jgi:hypothetical protein
VLRYLILYPISDYTKYCTKYWIHGVEGTLDVLYFSVIGLKSDMFSNGFAHAPML